MRKCIKWKMLAAGICCVGILLSLPSNSIYATDDSDMVIANDETGIPDKALYEVVLKNGDEDKDGILTRGEAEKITSIYYDSYDEYEKIESIKGIQFLSNLQSLSLLNHNISDLSSLSSLSSLEELALSNNNISDLSGLGSLSKLKSLSLSNNNVSDINHLSGLSGLSSLGSLYLDNNNISDISGLSGLSSLGSLSLDNNNISDISTLSSMNSLYSLSLEGNNISDISGLSSLSSLRSLYLNDNSISDISCLSGLSSLGYLYLNNNNISDISSVGSLSKLYYLELNNNNISDISSVGSLSSLSCLELSNNNISDISMLSNLSLMAIDLSGTNVSDISVLSGMSNLQSVNLSNTNISDFSVLSGMSRLYTLSLSNNNISDISMLKDLSHLKELDLSNNNISDISALSGISLHSLKLENNNISDISGLRGSKLISGIAYHVTNFKLGYAAYYDKNDGNLIKRYEFANGNHISIDQALEILPEELLNANVYRYDSKKDDYVKTDETWLDTENFVTSDSIGWSDEGFWYENGVKQGVKYNEDGSIDLSYRGKEIYDPVSNAWYWLDNVQNGAVAKSKDVYQESAAGAWADNKVYNEDGSLNPLASTGKWVRYDENGHMIKGWQTNDAGTYYFDTVYGTMAKGHVVIGDNECYFDENTGIGYNGWLNVDGINYWYENGIRQGYNVNDASYRGKEIYDPASDAWYWLDNVQNGAVAKSKDVYQESYAGVFADRPDGTGKWVRYDADGHMIKGWSEVNGNIYYFDYQTGAMAKGWVNLDGVDYYFDEATGIRA